jgi:glycopeptide antibiotics resistance protein
LAILLFTTWRNRKRGWKALSGIILFGLYIIAVVGVIFFPISIPLNWPNNLSWEETLRNLYRTNLSPLYFLSITRHPFSLKWLLVDFGLNAILTIPFGFGLGTLHRPKWLKLCLWAVLIGLTLEGIQLIVKLGLGTFYHTVDINDVILNALGVILGYGIFRIIQSIGYKLKKSKTSQSA